MPRSSQWSFSHQNNICIPLLCPHKRHALPISSSLTPTFTTNHTHNN
jgi:hypothetical protein